MTISQRIALAVAEAGLPHDHCMACQRQGLPILPLRRALVPDTRPECVTTVAGHLHICAKPGLRTLRMGYLYVLLDQQVWQAYAVSAQGHLRRFDPYAPPAGPPGPLPEKCAQENHDIPAAFVTIDTDKYNSAWLAFSSDAWPVSVLNAYKQGVAPRHRFVGIDLTQARTHPQLLGLAMTADQLQVDNQVFEYSQQACAPFDSVHGFHSRWLRRFALRGYVVNASDRHQLASGVLALVLDDTVGLIQEYNHQRLSWVVKRQVWREDPQRAYQLQTSQIVQVIRATHREWAAQGVPSLQPVTGDGPPIFVDPAVERQRLVERAQLESDARLEERYHEPQRAAFQAEYEAQDAEFQRYIDQDAQAYVALFDTPMFKVAERHDYDGRDRESGVAYTKTMGLCLGGGVTEAVVASLEPRQPPAGTSERLWQVWLQNPDSPPYRALLMRDNALLAALFPSFSGDQAINWNDSDKLFGMVSKVIASDDAGLRMRNSLKQAIAETQSAVNAASQRLAPSLGPGIYNAVRHLNSAIQFLYNGVQLIELEVKMKLGEYYALQSAHLRQLQHRANASLAEARDRMYRSVDDFEVGSLKAMRKVRPILQHGLMSLALLDPRLTNTVISVTVWVEGTAAQVHGRLVEAASIKLTQASSAAHAAMVDISVAAGTLDSNARKLLDGMKITAHQASQLVRGGFSGLRGVAGSWEVLLGIGGLYLQYDSLNRNQEKAEAEIGPKAYEAKLALQGSQLGMLGGQIELVGLVLRTSIRHLQAPWARGAAVVGGFLISLGALISSVAGVFDVAQAFAASKRAVKSGSILSSKQYALSGVLYLGGSAAFALAVASPLIAGPLGVAIVLTLSAYTYRRLAENNELNPLELWLSRSLFGKGGEIPSVRWDSVEWADIAMAELNAATLGLQIGVNFDSVLVSDIAMRKVGGVAGLVVEQKIKFQISLPRYDEVNSGYDWALLVHRAGDGEFPDCLSGELVASGSHNFDCPELLSQTNKFLNFAAPRFPDYRPDVSLMKSVHAHPESAPSLELTGVIALMPTAGAHTIKSATLTVAYWPDKNISSARLESRVQAENA